MEPPKMYHNAEVVYLLGRGLHLEHPHMIEVQYPSHQRGPTLQDVKVRLTALRGKGMPESFSWSYKRNYKGSFIWCDISDNDTILPVSGSGEYVLKALELFDASPEQAREHDDFHPASMRLKSLGSATPDKLVSRQSLILEHLQMESDDTSALTEDLIMCNAVNLTSDSSMDQLNEQLMDSLSHSKTAPEVCSLDHSDVSSCGTYPSEEIIENTVYSEVRTSSKKKTARAATKSGSAKRDGTSAASSSQTDVSSNGEMSSSTSAVMDISATTTTSKGELSTFSFTPTGAAKEKRAKRRTWKEVGTDKPAIFTTLGSRKCELEFSSFNESDRSGANSRGYQSLPSSPQAPCYPGDADPLLYVLKKAARLGGYKPQMCRSVDVVQSAQHTSKVHYGSKSKPKCEKPATFEKIVKEILSAPAEKSPRRSKTAMEVSKPERDVKALASILKSLESRSAPSRSPRRRGDANGTDDRQVVILPETVEPPRAQEAKSRESTSHPKGNKLDAKINAKIISKVVPGPAVPVLPNPTEEEAAHIPTVTRIHRETGWEKSFNHRNSPDLTLDEGTDIPTVTKVHDESKKPSSTSDLKSSKNRVSPRYEAGQIPSVTKLQDRNSVTSTEKCSKSRSEPAIKESTKVEKSSGTSVSKYTFTHPTPLFDNSSACKHNAAIQTHDDKMPKPACRKVSNGSQPPPVDGLQYTADSNNQITEPSVSDTRTSCSHGSTNGVTTSTSAVAIYQGAGALNDHSPRTKDYRTRDERPLTPGLTILDWEKTLQEAVMHSQPPVDLVLHECMRCGRTFKLDSLKVHMRGCHAISKPRSTVSLRNRESR